MVRRDTFARGMSKRRGGVTALVLLLSLSAACDGVIGDPAGAEPERPWVGGEREAPLERAHGPAVGRRLTREEVFNSIEVTLGVELDRSAYDLPVDPRGPGAFRNTAESLLLSPARVRAYDAIAADVVSRIDWSSVVAEHTVCTSGASRCRRHFVRSIGRELLRGPVPDAEVDSYAVLYDVAREEGEGFAAFVQLVVRAMLQSPRFLYRLEHPSPAAGPTRLAGSFELATRLSFLVWNAAPDVALIDLADAGELEASVEAETRRLLAHPRARLALRQYVEQWLHLDAIPAHYELGAQMKDETYRLFDRVVWDEAGDFTSVLRERRTELEPELASHYGLSSRGPGRRQYEQPSERLGLLTHASVLTARTRNPRTTIIDRGIFVLEDVLCEQVPEPEGDALRAAIDAQTIPESSGLSQRERFARQSEDPLCASCHARFDPLGIAFEVFGPTGGYQTEDEHGNPLTGSGVVALGDVALEHANVVELAEALSHSRSVARCMVEKVVQHAYGRAMGSGDDALVDDVHARFEERGRSYQELIVAIATHPSFALVEASE